MRFCGLLPLFTSFIALNPLHACNKEYLKKLLEEDNSEKLTEKEVNPKLLSQEKIKTVSVALCIVYHYQFPNAIPIMINYPQVMMGQKRVDCDDGATMLEVTGNLGRVGYAVHTVHCAQVCNQFCLMVL